MTTYVDTSAFIAILDGDDKYHAPAFKAWREELVVGNALITSGCVVTETVAVLHARAGTAVVRGFVEQILPAVEVVWPDDVSFDSAVAMQIETAGKSGPSLTDCAGFKLINEQGIEDVLTYDKHFAGRGFNLIGQSV